MSERSNLNWKQIGAWGVGIGVLAVGSYFLIDAMLSKKDERVAQILKRVEAILQDNLGVINEEVIVLIHELAAKLAEKEYLSIMDKSKQARREPGLSQSEYSEIVRQSFVDGGALSDEKIYEAVELCSITKTKYKGALSRIAEVAPEVQFHIIYLLEKLRADQVWKNRASLESDEANQILEFLIETWDKLNSQSWRSELIAVRKAKLFDLAYEKYNKEIFGILTQNDLKSNMECSILLNKLKAKMGA